MKKLVIYLLLAICLIVTSCDKGELGVEKFEGKNSSVLSFGRGDADLIDTIDNLSYKLIK
jgi:hypothetical protein